MATERDTADNAGTPPPSVESPKGQARGWVGFTRLLTLGVFSQAVLAGIFLSGPSWARTVHGFLGPAVIFASLIAAVVATTTRKRWSSGNRLAILLALLTTVLVVQNLAGELSSGGSLLWLHVPLGVAVVGLAAQPSIVAGRMTRQK
jgi:hypothetical protein